MKNQITAFWIFVRQQPLYVLYLLLLTLVICKQWINPAELVDSVEYRIAAKNISNGQGWSACLQTDTCDQLTLPETRRTPGYPLLISLFYFSNLLLLFQVMLAALVPKLMHTLLLKIGKEQCFKMGLALLLLYPLQFYYAAMLMPEIICQVLVLYLIIAWIDKRWIRVAIALTFLLLLKPVFMPWAWLVLVAKFWIKNKQRIWLALPIATVFLVSWFNFRQTGLIHYTSMPVTNAFEYNIRNLTKGISSEDYYNVAALKMKGMDFSGKYLFMQSETQKVIRMSPFKYAYLHVLGSAKALLDPGRYDMVAFFELPQGRGFMDNSGPGFWASQPPVYWMYIILFALLALLKLCLSVFAVFKKIPHKWILIFPVFYTVAVIGPVGSARYLLPVMPIIIMLSAIGLNILFNKKYHESAVAE